MRIGLVGGTFDPVHFGHLLLAERVRDECDLDEVWFLPALRPPHKLDSTISSAASRIDMLEVAIAGNPSFRIERTEVARNSTSYTFETLERLTAAHADHEWWFVIGADSLADFGTWRKPERIAELAMIVVVNRGRWQPGEALRGDELDEAIKKRLVFVDIPGVDFSATDIRQRVANGQSIRYMTPRSVEAVIETNGLYRSE